ncbi:E3 ubiquitin protein ligase MARCH8 [Echinococcus multilocularis]|uniref:E3 ubiquitin protein ligase MARCH8 n=1 Tax=Echinococcus multilocularis TaxID=6211 RepID=A0A0S4MNM2_ECHMU|nr:E3 ubiquitin protein ligase MARCH8 [Echinococcus multilocularis]
MDDVQREARGLSRDCNDSNGSSFATLFCSSSHLFTESNASWKSPSPKAFATASVPPLPTPNVAANPQAVGSTSSICQDGFYFCRICRESNEFTNEGKLDSCGRLIAPCMCDGSLKYVHERCVQHWIEVSQSRNCEWKRRLFFSRMLFNLLTFDSITLLLTALVIWWCVFVVTDFDVYKHFPAMPFGVSIPIIIMAIPLSVFGMIVFIFTTRFYRKLSDLWCRLNCVSVVGEPPEERIASLRLQHHSQCIQAHVDDESDIFTAIP